VGISEQALFIKDLFDFFENASADRVEARRAPRTTARAIWFEFQNVSFAYPSSDKEGSDKEVLSGVSFTFEAGERIALVGENGAARPLS